MPYPVHRKDDFVELLEDLQDPELISMVKKSRREIEEGEVVELEELKSYLGLSPK